MTEAKTTGIIAKAEKGKADKPLKNIKDYINAYKDQIARALPSVMTADRFTRMALSAVSSTPKLAECEVTSFLGSMMSAAQLGLEPNTPLGQAYLIPYRNNKKGVTECQFQIGYKGLIDLAYRSDEIKTIQAHIVYENDFFDYEYGLESKLKHKPAITDRGKPIYVYALFKLKNGGEAFEVMSVEECQKHGQKYSKSYNNSPWQTNPEEMMKKTVLKRVLKYAPLRSDFVRGVQETDETTATFDAASEEPELVINPETGEIIEDKEDKE